VRESLQLTRTHASFLLSALSLSSLHFPFSLSSLSKPNSTHSVGQGSRSKLHAAIFIGCTSSHNLTTSTLLLERITQPPNLAEYAPCSHPGRAWSQTAWRVSTRLSLATNHHPQATDLQNILRRSCDYLTIMPKLRSTCGGHLIYRTSYDCHKKNWR